MEFDEGIEFKEVNEVQVWLIVGLGNTEYLPEGTRGSEGVDGVVTTQVGT